MQRIRRGIRRRLRLIARWGKTNPLAEQGILILLYHRVAELRSDPWSLAVTPRHFAEHLEILRRYAHPIRLQQLSQGLLDDNSRTDPWSSRSMTGMLTIFITPNRCWSTTIFQQRSS
jgi:hypothetical protein